MAELIPVDFNPFENDVTSVSISTTEEQREIWTSIQVGGNAANLSYNESVSLILKGNFQYKAFCFAVQKTIERHESLRAVISADGNTVTFKKDLSIEIPLVDLSSSTNRDVELEKFIRNEMNQAFELTHGPLARIHVIKLDEKKHQVIQLYAY